MPARRRRSPTSVPQPGSAFHITRLDQKPEPPLPEPVAQVPAPPDLLAARFTNAADVLTFVAAVRDDLHPYPPVHRAPDNAIWALVSDHKPEHNELTWALGGVVHLPEGPDLVSPGGRRYRWAEVRAWPTASWIELAAGVAPSTGAIEQHEIVVVTTGLLARWIIDRFQSVNVELKIATTRLRPIYPSQLEDWAAVLIRVTGRGRTVPKAFSFALSGLPNTVVCRTSGGRLLIDQRLVLPVPDVDLARWVPGAQEWLLAGDLGVWQFNERSAEYPPPLRIHPALRPPPPPAAGRLPLNLEVNVRLVNDEQPRTVSALLLSDAELVPLRRFLTGQPIAERAFLVVGPGWHLFADPGRDVSGIPFGVPLHRIGPGALYQEVGYRLAPALPGPARTKLFAVDEQSAVVLQAGQAHRLALVNTVPIWALWLGPSVAADPVDGRLSAAATAILEQVDAADARADRPDLGKTDSSDLADVRAEGFLLEQQGKLAQAARKYWEAGDPALAARLYELAAEAEA